MIPKVVCVLGMHRSGTSVATRVLNILGLYLGRDEHLMRPGPANPAGYWEHQLITDLNSDVLSRLGGSWHRVPPLPPGWERSSELADLRRRARDLVDGEFGGRELWGFKDPRTSLTLPFWQGLLPPMRYVVCLRNPVDVAHSLERTRGERIPFEAGLDLWVTYLGRILANTVGHERLFVFYQDLMENPRGEVRRLARFLGRPKRAEDPSVRSATEAFVEDELWHQRTPPAGVVEDPALRFPIKALYLALRLSVRHGVDVDAWLQSGVLDAFGLSSIAADEESKRLDRTVRDLLVTVEKEKELRQELQSSLENRDTEVGQLRQRLTEEQEAAEEGLRLRRELETRLEARDTEVGELRQTLTEEQEAAQEGERLRRELERRLGGHDAEVADLRTALGEQREVLEHLQASFDSRGEESARLRRLAKGLEDLRVELRQVGNRLQREVQKGPRKSGQGSSASRVGGRGGQAPGREARRAGERAGRRPDGPRRTGDAARPARQGTGKKLPGDRGGVAKVREVVTSIIPSASTVLVVSKGDDRLLQLEGREAWHFPRTADGTYAGHHPADSLAAVAHLEALRARGADHLVIPKGSLWWLEHYAGFRRHLERRYRTLHGDSGRSVIYSLEDPVEASEPDGALDTLTRVVKEFGSRTGRDPAILEWGTQLRLSEALPELTVFSPPSGESLPYLDGTVDVVVVPDEGDRVREARRVAGTALIRIDGREEPSGGVPTTRGSQVAVEWLPDGPEERGVNASLILISEADPTTLEACLGAIAETLPAGFDGDLVLVVAPGAVPDDASAFARRPVKIVEAPPDLPFAARASLGAEGCSGEFLIFVSEAMVPLEASFPWLLGLLRGEEKAGAVGGRLLSSEGALLEAGGLLFSDGSVAHRGSGDLEVESPRYNHVKQVDFCSPTILASRREVFVGAGGFDNVYRTKSYASLDFCLRLRREGLSTYYQPRANAVVLTSAEPSVSTQQRTEAGDRAADQAELVERWRDTLELQSPPVTEEGG